MENTTTNITPDNNKGNSKKVIILSVIITTFVLFTLFGVVLFILINNQDKSNVSNDKSIFERIFTGNSDSEEDLSIEEIEGEEPFKEEATGLLLINSITRKDENISYWFNGNVYEIANSSYKQAFDVEDGRFIYIFDTGELVNNGYVLQRYDVIDESIDLDLNVSEIDNGLWSYDLAQIDEENFIYFVEKTENAFNPVEFYLFNIPSKSSTKLGESSLTFAHRGGMFGDSLKLDFNKDKTKLLYSNNLDSQNPTGIVRYFEIYNFEKLGTDFSMTLEDTVKPGMLPVWISNNEVVYTATDGITVFNTDDNTAKKIEGIDLGSNNIGAIDYSYSEQVLFIAKSMDFGLTNVYKYSLDTNETGLVCEDCTTDWASDLVDIQNVYAVRTLALLDENEEGMGPKLVKIQVFSYPSNSMLYEYILK